MSDTISSFLTTSDVGSSETDSASSSFTTLSASENHSESTSKAFQTDERSDETTESSAASDDELWIRNPVKYDQRNGRKFQLILFLMTFLLLAVLIVIVAALFFREVYSTTYSGSCCNLEEYEMLIYEGSAPNTTRHTRVLIDSSELTEDPPFYGYCDSRDEHYVVYPLGEIKSKCSGECHCEDDGVWRRAAAGIYVVEMIFPVAFAFAYNYFEKILGEECKKYGKCRSDVLSCQELPYDSDGYYNQPEDRFDDEYPLLDQETYLEQRKIESSPKRFCQYCGTKLEGKCSECNDRCDRYDECVERLKKLKKRIIGPDEEKKTLKIRDEELRKGFGDMPLCLEDVVDKKWGSVEGHFLRYCEVIKEIKNLFVKFANRQCYELEYTDGDEKMEKNVLDKWDEYLEKSLPMKDLDRVRKKCGDYGGVSGTEVEKACKEFVSGYIRKNEDVVVT